MFYALRLAPRGHASEARKRPGDHTPIRCGALPRVMMGVQPSRVAPNEPLFGPNGLLGGSGGGESERDLATNPEVGIRLSLCLIELVHPPLVGTLSEAGGVSITEEVNIVGAKGHFQLRECL